MHKRRFGDRKEGRYLRNLSPYYSLMPFIMHQRSDAQNYFKYSIEVSQAIDYIRRKRKEGLEHLGFLHLFVATYVRMLSQCPALNRFISAVITILEPKPSLVRNIFICSLDVFWASSSIIKLSSRVRPRI